jgi:hypothetical protein
MKKDVLLTISISAFLAVTLLAFVPWADAIQKAGIAAAAMKPADNAAAAARAQNEHVMDGIMSSVVESLGRATAPHSDVGRVLAGQVNCPHCDLHGAYFTDVSFRNADLTGANLVRSRLTRADLTGAKLSFASIKGADLSSARGLTQAQLNSACSDSETKVPEGLHAVRCS